MNTKLDIKDAYAAVFRDGAPALSGHDVSWLQQSRAEAIAAFQEHGFPVQKSEAWRYTNLKPLGSSVYALADTSPDPDLETGDLAAALTDGPRLVFLNGRLADQSGCADIDGIRIESLADILRKAPDELKGLLATAEDTLNTIDGPSLLNSAFMQDGFVIRIEDGAAVDQPIEIIHNSSCDETTAFHSRNIVVAGAGSGATIIERFTGAGAYWNNMNTGVTLGTGAEVAHYISQSEAADAVHMMRRDVDLSADSRYRSFALSLGASVARDETHLAFSGERATAEVDGVFLASENQSRDTLVNADHRIGNTSSNQRFKGVLSGRAKGTFQGTIRIGKGAAGTEAHQSCNSLILERGAEANAKPELLIFADDVKCSHGATVGEIDKAALFYLLSRGISPDIATSMLVEAFAAGVVETIETEAVREAFGTEISSWMAGHGAVSDKALETDQ